mgnify:CR=1 FL=1
MNPTLPNETHSLEQMLMTELSRRNAEVVAGFALQEPLLFDELFRLYAANREPVSRRAAWAIDLVSEREPALIEPYLAQIADLLAIFLHDGLKRHSLRILARSPLPTGDRLARLINTCFDWLQSPKEAIAVKVHCMEILYRISRQEPELQKELAASIEWRLEEESAGFRNRGRKLLRRLYKDIPS